MYNSDAAAADYMNEFGGLVDELPEDFVNVEPCDDDITSLKWKLYPMYKKDANGVERVWQVGFDGISIWSLNGTSSSSSISTTEVVLTRSCSTLSEQAMVRCNALYLAKYNDGYQFAGDKSERILKPMKGHDYEKCKRKIWPMICDAKMDGVRMTATMTEDGVNCLSYGRKSFNHLSLIRGQLMTLFAYLPDCSMTDGELYIHGVPFHEIVSIAKSNVNEHARISEIKYYIFDVHWPINPPADDRYKTLSAAYNKYLRSVESTSLRIVPKCYVWSEEDLGKYVSFCVSAGYEGVVMRHSKINRTEGKSDWEMTRYSFGRSFRLFKVKPYYCDEGIVVRVSNSKGNEKEMCKLVLKLRDGNEMSIRFGSGDQKKAWKKDPKLILGKILEFKYPKVHEVTRIPQMAIGLHLRPTYS